MSTATAPKSTLPQRFFDLRSPALRDALEAARAVAGVSIHLDRIVGYALGEGDPTSRASMEKYGPLMYPAGQPTKGSGWFPTHYSHIVGAADSHLPAGYGVQSGKRPDGRPFARAWTGTGPAAVAFDATKAPTEALARLDVTLQACIHAAGSGQEQGATTSPAAAA